MPDAPPLSLTSPIEAVPGVGPRRGEALRRLGIPSVAHLVHYLPSRHSFEAAESPIAELRAGEVVTARGEIASTRVTGRRPRQRFEAILADETGELYLVFFNQPYLSRTLVPGTRVLVKGPAREFKNYLQLANPAYEVLLEEADDPTRTEARLRPVYPATEELNSAAIEEAVQAVLESALPLIEDHLPEAFRAERGLPSLAEAYRMMHRPANEEETRIARRRLAYDEFLLLQLALRMKRAQHRAAFHAPALRWSDAIDEHIRRLFPFSFTEGQDASIADVVADLQRSEPANRLIQGDVGSGKTVVALYAMLMAAADRKQAALMAPTEILAEQHYLGISSLLEGSKVRVELLTGSLPPAERDAARARVAGGESGLIIGTHALLTEQVAFDDLAVAVIDEQHRFGVHQRAALREKAGDDASTPHVLVMTATPIPRTLSMTVFGDLDISVIRGMPPGRKPVLTRVLAMDATDAADAEARVAIERGEQVYVVAPTIDGGEEQGLRSLRAVRARLESGALAGKRIAALHGRMARQERAQVMERFRAGLIDCLVATTVIEVGVDVPNATLMIVEHAERFGLAQLHQLRGRVGRGEKPGECILLADATTPDAAARLAAIEGATDGFDLAEKDLEIRGPGEVVGARQSGAAPFRVAALPGDLELLLLARRDATAWIGASPNLVRPEEGLLRRRLMKAHGEALGLADVA